MKRIFMLSFLTGLFYLSWGQTAVINENIQSWANHGSYGNYTQAISAGNVTMTSCIVANAASATGTCSAGRVQMQASTGIIELPSVPTVTTAEFHLAAGGSGRSVKLQKYNGSGWDDITTFTGIGTTGATFTFSVNTSSATILRLSSPSAALYVHDIIIYNNPSTPLITVGSITAFGNQQVNTTSAEKSYIVSGANLTDDIIITPPAGFEISTTSGSGYVANPSSITLTQSGGTVSNTTIYVVFKPTAVTSYSGNISHTSTGATTMDVACSGTGISVADPVSFSATANGTSQIDLAATANGSGNNILVIYNGSGTFGSLIDGIAPGNPGDAFGGGTIFYKGSAASLPNHTGLSGGQTVYYKAYSYDVSYNYSPGLTANATTLKEEPTNHPASFSVSTIVPTYKTIQVSWTDATGGTIPDAYLIKGSSVGFSSITDPVDGVAELNGTLIKNVNAGVGTYTFSNLSPATSYYFKIYPYTNAGADINYKTSGTVPSDSATTSVMPWVEDFETGTKTAYAAGTVTCTKGSWTMDEALIGNSSSDHRIDLQCVRMRNAGGSIYMNFDKNNGAGTVTVYHAKYGSSDVNSTWKLQISIDGGANWTDVGSEITSSTYTLTSEVFTVNKAGNVRLKIVHITGGSSARINIDDITVTDYIPPASTSSIIDGNWSNNAIWNNGPCGTITDVTISANTTVTLDQNDSCKNVTIEPNGTLIIASGNRIGVTQKFIVKSDASGTGALIDLNTSSSVNGSIEIERFISPDRWHFISSPVTNAASNVLRGSWLKDFNENTCTWNNPFRDTTVILKAGKGYAIWDTTTGGKKFIFPGTPNMGNISPTIYSDTGFKLAGNPYPSAITWDDLSWIKTDIGATVYTWNGSNYVSWNGSVGSLNNGIIPAGQGFFVYAFGTSPVLTIPANARTNNNQSYYKSSTADVLALKAEGNGYHDQTFIHFHPNATPDFDNQFDGIKLWGITESPQIYSYGTHSQYSINVLPQAGTSDVAVGFIAGVSGNYTITASEINSFDPNMEIHLEDLKTSQTTDLRLHPVYNFSANSSDAPGRFIIHFANPAFTINTPEKNNIHVYSSFGKIYISTGGVKGTAYIYNLQGKVVSTAELNPDGTNIIPLGSTGHYLVKVITGKFVNISKVFCLN